MQIVGAASGGRDPLQPLAHWGSAPGAGAAALTVPGRGPAVRFERVQDLAALERALGASS